MLCAALALSGCADEAMDASSGASEGVARIDMEVFSSSELSSAQASPPLIRFQGPGGIVYSLTAAQLGLESIRFRFPKTLKCAEVDYQSAEFSDGLECSGHWLILRGPFSVDLRSPGNAKERTSWRIPALDYRRVELRLEPVSSPNSGARTLEARASFEANNAIRELRLDFQFRATLAEGIDAALADQQILVLGLDVAGWLTRIPVAGCLKRGYLSPRTGQVQLDDTFDADTMPSYQYTSPRVDCADAQNRFRLNLIDSLRAKIATPKPDAAAL